VTGAAKALKAALEAQQSGDAALNATEAELNTIKAVEEGQLKALCSVEDWKANDAAKQCQAVLKLLKDCVIDESLSKSLPSCCAKAPAERGDFDKMALEQVEKTLKDKASTLSAKLEEGAAAKVERAKAVEEAQKASDVAAEAKKAAAEALLDAEVEKENAAEALRAAKAEVAKYEPQLTAANAALEEAKEAVKHFQEKTLASFETLEKKESTAEEAPAIEADKLGA